MPTNGRIPLLEHRAIAFDLNVNHMLDCRRMTGARHQVNSGSFRFQ